MRFKAQTKEYNCGPTACAYYLKRFHGIDSDIEELERLGNCTDEDGTSHEGMFNILYGAGIKPHSFTAKNIKELIPLSSPCIVNYQYDGDGHYGVLIGFRQNHFTIWNPATGHLDYVGKEKFAKIWYSKRYGKRWLIR